MSIIENYKMQKGIKSKWDLSASTEENYIKHKYETRKNDNDIEIFFENESVIKDKFKNIIINAITNKKRKSIDRFLFVIIAIVIINSKL